MVLTPYLWLTTGDHARAGGSLLVLVKVVLTTFAREVARQLC